MAKKNKNNNYIWIGIAVVAVVVLAIVFISNNNSQKTQNDQNKVSPVSPGNFYFLKYSYLNEKTGADSYGCTQNKTCEANGVTFDCPKTDLLTISYKTINLDSTTWLTCTVNDGNNLYTNQHFYYNSDSNTAEINNLLVSYNANHDLLVCCTYNDGQAHYDEFCLPKAQIKSLC